MYDGSLYFKLRDKRSISMRYRPKRFSKYGKQSLTVDRTYTREQDIDTQKKFEFPTEIKCDVRTTFLLKKFKMIKNHTIPLRKILRQKIFK